MKRQGPYKITRIENKQAFIYRYGSEPEHSISQLRPFLRDPKEHRTNFLSLLHAAISSSDNSVPSCISSWVYLTNVLNPCHPKCKHPNFIPAKAKEIADLFSHGTWTVIDIPVVPSWCSILNSWFAVTIQIVETPNPRIKARFVVIEHRDSAKQFLVHNITTLRQIVTKRIISVATILRFRFWRHDISQAFAQSKNNVFNAQYSLARINILYSRSNNPITRENYPPSCWCSRLLEQNNVVTDRKTPQHVSIRSRSGSLLPLRKNKVSNGLVCVYVKYFILAGPFSFLKFSEQSLYKFESRSCELDDSTFARVKIISLSNPIRLCQVKYIKKFQFLSAASNLE